MEHSAIYSRREQHIKGKHLKVLTIETQWETSYMLEKNGTRGKNLENTSFYNEKTVCVALLVIFVMFTTNKLFLDGSQTNDDIDRLWFIRAWWLKLSLYSQSYSEGLCAHHGRKFRCFHRHVKLIGGACFFNGLETLMVMKSLCCFFDLPLYR